MATRADVARLAGVSESTVSYALNGQRSIKAETRQRVLAAVEKLNYTPHFAAGVLAGGKSNSIALIFPSYGGSFSSLHLDYVEGIIAGARERNFHVIVWPGEDTSSTEILRFHKTGLVSGVILMEILDEDERVNSLTKAEIPFVMIGRTARPEKFKYVDRDFEGSARISLEYLQELGHQRIAVLTHSREVAGHLVSVDERFTVAMKSEAKKLGIGIEVITKTNSIDGGFESFKTFEGLNEASRVTGVIGLADLMTLGFISAAQQAGVRIPDDISVVGLNNPRNQISLIHPNLTVVSLPAHEMGKAAANILIDELTGENSHTTQQLWGGDIAPAQSSGAAPKGRSIAEEYKK